MCNADIGRTKKELSRIPHVYSLMLKIMGFSKLLEVQLQAKSKVRGRVKSSDFVSFSKADRHNRRITEPTPFL